MVNNEFKKIKKTLAILLILCFVLSVTVAEASAAGNSKYGKGKDGYRIGYNQGYKDGKIQGQKDCKKYGIRDILQKMSPPPIKESWTKYFKVRYNKGYTRGFVEGYSQSRYNCLQK